MSLLIWLPLNGDLRNQGLSDLVFTNTNSVNIYEDDNGKIGKCYIKPAAKKLGSIESDKTILLDGDLSMCCWAKVTEDVGSDTANGLISNHTAADSSTGYGFGINIKRISANDYRICCSTGSGSNGRTYRNYYGTTNIKNAWHHLALTYNHTKEEFQLWVDGKVEKTQQYKNVAIESKFKIFNWSVTNTNKNYLPACALNDVRVYDHCLSAKEIEEISKGMILHYKLTEAPLQNVLTSTVSKTGTIKSGNYVYTTYWYINNDYKSLFTTGKIITVEYDYSVENITSTNFYIYTQLNGSRLAPAKSEVNYDKISTNPTGHVVVSYQVSADQAASNEFRIRVRLMHANVGASMTISNPQLYIGLPTNIIYDVSGYHNDGIKYGNLPIMSSAGGKYEQAVLIKNGLNSYINSPKIHLPDDQITFNIWCQSITGESGGGNYHTILTSASGNPYTMSINLSGQFRSGLYIGGNGQVKNVSPKVMLNQQWHMCTMTYDGNSIKRYVDGVLSSSDSITGSLTNTFDYFTFGRYDGKTTYYCKNIGINDIRIYATALTESQIKELYNTSGTIDNLGNIYVRELVE